MQDCRTILGIIEMREQGTPYEICQSRFGVGSSVVTSIMKRFEQLKRPLDQLKTLPPAEVEKLFYPDKKRRHKKIPLPDYETIHGRLSAEGSKLNLYMIWLEYRKENSNGYGYTQFIKYYREYVQETYGSTNLKMIVHRVPGERMYVDWMGDQPRILLDPETGEKKPVHIFCATLGVSSIGYAEVFEDESMENFIQGIVHALGYFGGLPRFIVTDNLRAAVTKHTKDTLVLTKACEDLENFYDVIILPPPPRKPKGKATVEWYVGYAERHLVEPLKEQEYTSIGDIMLRTRTIVDDLNTRIDRGRSTSRRAMFEQIDLPQMRPLPAEAFAIWHYTAVPTVPDTYHVAFDKHRYSVPYQMAGQPVIIKSSMSDIVITDQNNRLIARHKRSYNDFPKDITDPAHLAPSHQFYMDVNEMNGAKYREWANSIGPATSLVVDCILSSAAHEEQMYESCTALMWYAKDISPDVIEAAAVNCVAGGEASYTKFRRIIAKVVNEPLTKAAETTVHAHGNLRGKEYFQ